jgi:hypothetical protein
MRPPLASAVPALTPSPSNRSGRRTVPIALGWRSPLEIGRTEIPAERIQTLAWHPVRLLSGIGSQYYYAAKKHALDKAAAAELARGDYDLFHGWSGECVRTLGEARKRGVPSVIEIPTWHRHKGKQKPRRLTKSERERAEGQRLGGSQESDARDASADSRGI